jgi:uncharacterized repeat protein (TIGR03806 family)
MRSFLTPLLLLVSLPTFAAEPFGIETRTPWTTSTVRGSPDPPLPLRAQRVFPKLSFKNPVTITSAPGTERLFVAEQTGKVFSIDPAAKEPKAELLIDANELVEQIIRKDSEQIVRKEKDEVRMEAVYGLTFHPQFAKNRECYLCYVVAYKDGAKGQHPHGTRVVRLKVGKADPPQADPPSEELVLTWLQGGHNGGSLKFGPDGCLYISTGDGGNAYPPDGRNTGQNLDDFLSCILRIDVDHRDAEHRYTVPPDNPFVGRAGALGEIWSYGYRNPLKISFDRQTGDLWAGDVGWELWELAFRVQKGANYGWSVMEGNQPVHAERERGPTPILPPTIEIPHSDGASVTGGFVYRGKKFPELVGSYIFGDWETRRIWAAKVSGDKVEPYKDICAPTVRIVDFAEDHAGELYLLDYDEGTIHTFVRNENVGQPSQFPRKLSETGLFAATQRHEPAAGVLPFSINAEQWSDGATAERYLALPGETAIRMHPRPTQVPGSMFSRTLDFPADAVLIKTLSLDVAGMKRRVETQMLHYDGRDWRAYTYAWNDEQTDAELVPAEGKQVTLGEGEQRRTWHYEARSACVRCHNPWGEHALAFNVPQINRPQKYGDVTDNQIRALRHVGILADVPEPKAEPPKSESQLPRLAQPFGEGTIEARARAYLHANCAHCHRNGGGGSAYLHLAYDLAPRDLRAIGVRPAQGTFGIANAEVLAPGDPFRSTLYLRMAKLGPGHMPHLGAREIDRRGLALIHDWIRQLSLRPDDAALIEKLAGLDEAGAKAASGLTSEILSTPSRALLAIAAIDSGRCKPAARELLVQAATKHADPVIRDLFEPYLPEEQRIKRLGEAIKPEEILKLAGDAKRGQALFHQSTALQCRTCHKVGQEGTDLGPDLTLIGKKLDRAKLLESILQPSKEIDPKFQSWQVETNTGKVVTGLLVKKDAGGITLKDARNAQQKVEAADIERSAPLPTSLMPELMLRDLTAQQAADLLGYLESLK